ncbi:hypothetical protein FHT77_005499 [Rhizobium sp. BK181]|nr:hypothetical protein [Rhizobium sp. BK181]
MVLLEAWHSEPDGGPMAGIERWGFRPPTNDLTLKSL